MYVDVITLFTSVPDTLYVTQSWERQSNCTVYIVSNYPQRLSLAEPVQTWNNSGKEAWKQNVNIEVVLVHFYVVLVSSLWLRLLSSVIVIVRVVLVSFWDNVFQIICYHCH